MKEISLGLGEPAEKGWQVSRMEVTARAIMDNCFIKLGPELSRFSLPTGIRIGRQGSDGPLISYPPQGCCRQRYKSATPLI